MTNSQKLYQVIHNPSLEELVQRKKIQGPVHIIDNPQQRCGDLEDLFAEALAANRADVPFLVIDPYVTPEYRNYIITHAQKVKFSQDGCAVFFTSGSTGMPKPVELTNTMFVECARAFTGVWGIEQGQKMACLLSLGMHSGFFFGFILPSFAKAEWIYLDKMGHFEGLLEQLAGMEVDYLVATPYHWSGIARILKEKKKKLDLQAVFAGSKIGEETLDVLLKYTAGVHGIYGSTEAVGTYALPAKIRQKPDTVGIPLPGASVEIIDRKGTPQPPSTEGNICIAGKYVSPFYAQPFNTGDLGYLDAEGDLFVTGRADNLLKIRGYRVNCSQLEEVYCQYNVCVFGVESKESQWHEAVAVFETNEPRQKIIEYVNQTSPPVSPFCRPRWIFTTDRLPVTITGKIDRVKVRGVYEKKITDHKSDINQVW